MPEYMTLLGTEDVRQASYNMQAAATEMKNAASYIEDSFVRQRQFMEEWLDRFEAVLKEKQVG